MAIGKLHSLLGFVLILLEEQSAFPRFQHTWTENFHGFNIPGPKYTRLTVISL